MFEKKKRCGNCGESVNLGYNFCPHCGESLKERAYNRGGIFGDLSSLGGMFGDVEKEFERIDRNFFEMPKKAPRISLRMPGGGGISVIITSGTGMRPKVDVKTYGEYKKMEPSIKRTLGVGGMMTEAEDEGRDGPAPRHTRARETKAPKVTEEPETEVKEAGQKQIIRIKLPDVKDWRDVEVKRLEQSVEVKAIAGDKAYFKLIPIKGRSVESKGFKDGVLTLEVGK